jgi:prepilin-type N-terminal cleavage/methylation domain-containing protein
MVTPTLRSVELSAAHRSRGFSLVEVCIALTLFALLSALAYLCLRQVIAVQRKASGRDEALRNLLRAQESLQRDLGNSSSDPEQWVYAPCQLAATAPFQTSDGLALLVADQNQDGLELSSDSKALHTAIATYYLALDPNQSTSFGGDAQGYEDQYPWKWLIRKQSPAPAPVFPRSLSALPAGWLASQLEQPIGEWKEDQRRVVARNLLQMRVVQGPPLWELSLSAISLEEAAREGGIGQMPLSQSKFCLTYRVSVVTRN